MAEDLAKELGITREDNPYLYRQMLRALRIDLDRLIRTVGRGI